MKSTHLIALATAMLVLAAAASAPAAGKNPQKPAAADAGVMAKYDADHNGNINVEEGNAIRSAFAKDPANPMLKPFDTNGDGALSDEEIMKIARKKAGKKAGVRQQGKKK